MEHEQIERKIDKKAIDNMIEQRSLAHAKKIEEMLLRESTKRGRDTLAKNMSVKNAFRVVKEFYLNRKFSANDANAKATKIVGSIIRVGRDVT